MITWSAPGILKTSEKGMSEDGEKGTKEEASNII